jgi:hypothetical protein
MSETELTYLVIGSIIFGLINAVRAASWKAKYETLDKERGNEGWAEEARFWRHHFNDEAADAANFRY